MKPLVSVIIVSFNTRDHTVKSLKTALASSGFTRDQIEVIVVDNHSQDDTVKYLKKNFPQVKIIVNKSNRGFGTANNQGAKAALGQYILLLNSDAFLSPDSLNILIDKLENNQDLIAVGPKLKDGDGHFQQSAGYFPTLIRVMAWMWWLDKLPLIKFIFPRPYHVFAPNWYLTTRYPHWLMGACVLFRRDEFLAVGGFDPKIFMYAEEVELFLRLDQQLKKRVLFTPETSVTHLGGSSGASHLTLELKGIEYLYAKHYPHLLPVVKLIILIGVIMRVVVFVFVPTRHKTVSEYLTYFKK